MVEIGRNDKCHCGSNKKYKKCCLMKDEQKKDDGGAIAGVLMGPLPAGAEDDFLNRFIFGIGGIRDAVLDREKRTAFDADFDVVFQNLLEAKFAKELCLKYMTEHRKAVEEKKDGGITGHQINVNNPIHTELNMFFKDFFIRNAMAVDGIKKVSKKWFGYDMSFLFADKEKEFEKGAKKFKISREHADFEILKNFIESHRSGWYDNFKDFRNKIEHEGYKLPKIQYQIDGSRNVHVVYPFDNTPQSIENTLNFGWENLLVLCEEIIVFVMSRELKDPFVVIRVPEEEREKYNWVKYRVAHKEFPEARCSF